MTSASLAEPLSPAVVALAHQQQLGRLRATYRPKRAPWYRVAGLIFFGLLTLIVAVGLLFFYLLWQFPNFNRTAAAKRLYIFDRGMVLADKNGPVDVYLWESMTALQDITRHYTNGVYTGTTYIYTLMKPGAKARKITQFYETPDKWGPQIQQGITEAQAPRAMASVAAGQTCQFGDLTIDRGGIGRGNKRLSWPEIEEVKISRGFVSVRKAGKWLNWSGKQVKEIPNVFVFLTVADLLHRQTRG